MRWLRPVNASVLPSRALINSHLRCSHRLHTTTATTDARSTTTSTASSSSTTTKPSTTSPQQPVTEATSAASTLQTTATPSTTPASPSTDTTTPKHTPVDGRTFHFNLRPPPQRTILFFGSDNFSLPTLRALTPSHPTLVCPADTPQGRGNKHTPLPVRTYARDNQLHCHVIPPTVDFRMTGWQLPPPPASGSGGQWDVGVVVSFGYMLPQRVIRQFRHGMINLHPSLLPRWRGASPIQHSLWAADTTTGVSVIDLHPTRMDAGRVLLQLTEPVTPTDTYASLMPRLAVMGSKAVLHALNHLSALRGGAVEQSSVEGGASAKAPKLSNEWSALDFTQPAQRVYSHWRASHGYVKAHTQWRGDRVNIVEMDGYDSVSGSGGGSGGGGVGDVWYDVKRRVLCVRCGCGGAVLVSRLHVANKPRAMDAQSFANGHMNTLATRYSVRFDPPTTSSEVLAWMLSTRDELSAEVIVDKM